VPGIYAFRDAIGSMLKVAVLHGSVITTSNGVLAVAESTLALSENE